MPLILFALFVMLLLVAFHDRTGGNFFSTVAVTTTFFCRLFDMFVLALLFFSNAPQRLFFFSTFRRLFFWHGRCPSFLKLIHTYHGRIPIVRIYRVDGCIWIDAYLQRNAPFYYS